MLDHQKILFITFRIYPIINTNENFKIPLKFAYKHYHCLKIVYRIQNLHWIIFHIIIKNVIIKILIRIFQGDFKQSLNNLIISRKSRSFIQYY